MALKSIRSFLTISFIMILFSAVIPSGNVHAMPDRISGGDLPSLDAFVEQVSNGQADELRGIYIAEILAAPIVQQPAGMDDFISPWQNILTRFSLASKFGSTGLLAHNYLAGETFALLQEGQVIHLIHGDGRISTFMVSDILQYQALEPDSISSTFVDLQSHALLTYSELFTKVYNRPGQVIFQTCMEAGDHLSWGRLFVIAEPVSQ
jgi:hypothetical protein